MVEKLIGKYGQRIAQDITNYRQMRVEALLQRANPKTRGFV